MLEKAGKNGKYAIKRGCRISRAGAMAAHQICNLEVGSSNLPLGSKWRSAPAWARDVLSVVGHGSTPWAAANSTALPRPIQSGPDWLDSPAIGHVRMWEVDTSSMRGRRRGDGPLKPVVAGFNSRTRCQMAGGPPYAAVPQRQRGRA